MPRWLKPLIAILLLPACIGAVKALIRIIAVSGQADTFWVAMLGGGACWLAIYLLLPKPMLVYVFGHELTHVLWAWLFGAKVKRFKVSAKGGHVMITKSNFLVALAPYFFPIYVLFVVVCFVLGHLIWGWAGYQVWFHWFLGVAYGFHLTLTWRILQTRQSDLTSHGTFFSLVIIFLGNVMVLLLGLPLLTRQVGILTAVKWWVQESYGFLWRFLGLF